MPKTKIVLHKRISHTAFKKTFEYEVYVHSAENGIVVTTGNFSPAMSFKTNEEASAFAEINCKGYTPKSITGTQLYL